MVTCKQSQLNCALTFFQVNLLSPVPTELNESSQVDSSLNDLQFQTGSSIVTGLRDSTANRFTMV